MDIKEIVKGTIAVLIVGGGIAAILLGSSLVPTLIPLVTAVLGFYFGSSDGEAKAYRAMGVGK